MARLWAPACTAVAEVPEIPGSSGPPAPRTKSPGAVAQPGDPGMRPGRAGPQGAWHPGRVRVRRRWQRLP